MALRLSPMPILADLFGAETPVSSLFDSKVVISGPLGVTKS